MEYFLDRGSMKRAIDGDKLVEFIKSLKWAEWSEKQLLAGIESGSLKFDEEMELVNASHYRALVKGDIRYQ